MQDFKFKLVLDKKTIAFQKNNSLIPD